MNNTGGYQRVIDSTLEQSTNEFLTVVYPKVKKYLKGEIIPCESVVDSNFMLMLDRKTGIDYWLIDKGVRGIATRLGYGRNYRSFNIRISRGTGRATEIDKMAYMHEDGIIHPHITVQAYLSGKGGEFLGAGIALTKDIYQAYKDKLGEEKHTKEGHIFYKIPWDVFKTNNIKFREL